MRKLLYGLLFWLLSAPVIAETVHIAAAANLRYVLPEIIAEYHLQSENAIAVTYAASGTISNQIKHGAPYQLFLSANAGFIKPLIELGLTKNPPFAYADAQLALFALHDSTVQLDVNLQGLKHYLQNKPDKKIAIANPQHAPYGIAAKQFMIEQGVWPLVEPYLVQAENAGQLTQFTLTGNVALGFIPFSHAIQPAIKAKGRFLKLSVILPQQGVLTIRATDAAADFVRFLSDDRARQLFTDHGFKVPE